MGTSVTPIQAPVQAQAKDLLEATNDLQKSIKQVQENIIQNRNHFPTDTNLRLSKKWNKIILSGGGALTIIGGAVLTGFAVSSGVGAVGIVAAVALIAFGAGAVGYSVYRNYQLGSQIKILNPETMKKLQEENEEQYRKNLVNTVETAITSQGTELANLKKKYIDLEKANANLKNVNANLKNANSALQAQQKETNSQKQSKNPNSTSEKENPGWNKTAIAIGGLIVAALAAVGTVAYNSLRSAG